MRGRARWEEAALNFVLAAGSELGKTRPAPAGGLWDLAAAEECHSFGTSGLVVRRWGGAWGGLPCIWDIARCWESDRCRPVATGYGKCRSERGFCRHRGAMEGGGCRNPSRTRQLEPVGRCAGEVERLARAQHAAEDGVVDMVRAWRVRGSRRWFREAGTPALPHSADWGKVMGVGCKRDLQDARRAWLRL